MVLVSLAAVLAVATAPALPLAYLFAAQVVVGSGRWADVPPAGLGLTGLVTLALVLKCVFVASHPPPDGGERLPGARPARPGVLPVASARAVGLAAGALVTVLAMTLAWSPSPAYGAEKLFRFALFNLLPAWLLWHALGSASLGVDRLLRALRLGLLVVALAGLAGVVAGTALHVARLSVGQTDPIAFGSLSAAGALLWYERLLSVSGERRARAGWAAVACLAAVIGSNSKGPAVALILTLVVTHVLLGNTRSRPRSVGGRLRRAVLPLGVMVTLFLLVPSQFVSRIDPRVLATVGREEGFSESFSLRHRLQGHARSMLAARPVTGAGLGGFNTVEETAYGDPLPSGGRTVLYPHNVPLEVAAEAGLLGLTALAVLALTVWSVLRVPVPRAEGAALVVLAAMLALFSGDLSDHRILWFGLALHLHVEGACRPWARATA